MRQSPRSEVEAEDLFEMANLFPVTTGLPMTVWVSPRGNARHDVRIEVHMTHGNQMNPANTAVVTVRPSPRLLAGRDVFLDLRRRDCGHLRARFEVRSRLLAGRLSPEDERAVFQWVTLNTDALIAYWDGQVDTIQLGHLLKPVTSAP